MRKKWLTMDAWNITEKEQDQVGTIHKFSLLVPSWLTSQSCTWEHNHGPPSTYLRLLHPSPRLAQLRLAPARCSKAPFHWDFVKDIGTRCQGFVHHLCIHRFENTKIRYFAFLQQQSLGNAADLPDSTYLGQAAVHGHGGRRGQGLLLQVLQGLGGGRRLLLLLLQHWGLLLALPVPQHPDKPIAQHCLCAGNRLPRLVVTQVLNESSFRIILESNLKQKFINALFLKEENISIISKPIYK